MTDYFAQLDTRTLGGCTIRALDNDGERLYLLRLLDLSGDTTNYVTTQQGIEAVRQEIERAMLSGLFGTTTQ